MDTHSNRSELTIRTPCPKRWEELSGDGRRRFCSECSLHVHNAAALTERQALALVAESEGRVCMRIECGPSGAPVFREEQGRLARLSRWALSAGTALLAACQGSVATIPGDPKPVQPPSRMGKVVAPAVLGDVATPAPARVEHMGVGEALPASVVTKPK
jgi:hypothetical protein